MGESFDYVVVYDNSCSLKEGDCTHFLDGVGEIISRIKDDDPKHSRVSVVEFRDHSAEIIVSFYDTPLQRNVKRLINFVKDHGDCTLGDGSTDTMEGVLAAIAQFADTPKSRNRKIIIVSGCRDTKGEVADFCADPDGKMGVLDGLGIDVYAVNLVKASSAKNRINNTQISG